jgi:hypothetical protein
MRRRPVQATSEPLPIPIPMGGLNTADSGVAMPPSDCLQVWNLIAAENGLRSRLGYREWCTGFTGSTDNKVRTLLSFSGSEPNQNRLFATTDTGIASATESTSTPTSLLSFAGSAASSGYGAFRVVVTQAGHFGLYCDEANGYHVYTESGATWAAVALGVGAGQVSGVNPNTFVHVTEFKRRVWFTERDSTSAWYLAAGAIYGAATEFDFGVHFSQGGHLVGLWNWTVDGGSGSDDRLVAISSAGDVVIYAGTDPASSSTFSKVGVWKIGPMPAGRDVVFDVGGDLYILCSQGLMPLSRLVVGAEVRAFETAKIQNLFNRLMSTRRELRGWSMHLHPEDNALVMLYPDYSTETSQQLVQALGAPGRPWFRYRDVPMHCAAVWEGRLHFGTQDGRVCVSRDDLDNVQLDDASDYERIEWRLLTSYQRLGGRNVQLHMIRPTFSVDGSNPDYTVEAKYGFDLSPASAPSASAAQSGTWDNAIWDVDLWGGDSTPFSEVRGAVGMGHTVAIALRGSNVARTTLVDLSALIEVGGWL